MPILPLPPLDDGVPLDGGDLPVSSSTDVANEWATEIQEVPIDPIRDAIQCGQTDMFLLHQQASSYAAAQSDPARAVDEYLDEILEEHSCPRKNGQDNEDARAVMFATPPVISPVAILAVANAILAPYTVIGCRYAERSDGWFVGDGTTPWSSHVFALADSGDAGATPTYPDRPATLARRPPGAMPNQDTYGRWFLLRVPDISSLDTEIAAVFDGNQNEPKPLLFISVVGTAYTSAPAVSFTGGGGTGAAGFAVLSGTALAAVILTNPGTGYTSAPTVVLTGGGGTGWTVIWPYETEVPGNAGGFFVGSGTNVNDDNVTFLFNFAATTVDDIYNGLISAVDNAVGFGIRWDMNVEPNLAV